MNKKDKDYTLTIKSFYGSTESYLIDSIDELSIRKIINIIKGQNYLEENSNGFKYCEKEGYGRFFDNTLSTNFDVYVTEIKRIYI